jgi:hypothetical protein
MIAQIRTAISIDLRNKAGKNYVPLYQVQVRGSNNLSRTAAYFVHLSAEVQSNGRSSFGERSANRREQMDNNQTGTVVGVFNDEHSAEQAVKDLQNQGFTQDQIGYAVRNLASSPNANTLADNTATATTPATTDTVTTHTTEEHRGGTREGLVMGGITGISFGSIVGAAAALLLPGIGPVIAGGILGAALAGAVAGAATGGVAGALLHWGFSQEEVDYYHNQFQAGRTLVTVHAGAREQEAQEILSRNGGYNLDSRPATVDEGTNMSTMPTSAGTSATSSATVASSPDATTVASSPDNTDMSNEP